MDFKAIINNPKTYFIGLVLAYSVEKVGGYILAGAEGDFDNKVEQGVIKSLAKEEVVKELMKNPKFVNIIIDTKEVQDLIHNTGEELRDEIITDVMKKDSSKIQQNAYLGMGLGIRDEHVDPLLLKMMLDYKDGKLVTKEELRLATGPRVTPGTWNQ